MNELMRVTYVSRSTFKPFKAQSGIEPNVARILSQSRRNNLHRHLVGVLYYGNGCFFQCLEGREQDIQNLLESLRKDPRHRDLEILSKEPIEYLSFMDWSMKYVSLDEQVQHLLKRHNMRHFDPYQFTPEMINQLVDTLQQLPEPARPEEVEMRAEEADSLLELQAAKSRMDRIVAYILSTIALLGSLFMLNLAMASGAIF
ncbi:MAG: BLUF domain-containing protein [Pseudomonadota bacterium]|nr:BLUF domain-containing protein [Pseudomonadota bacterium]